jgi:hypothetical protein
MTDISILLFDTEALAQEGKKVQVWDARPFQTVSLLDVLYFYAAPFTQGTTELQRLLDHSRHESEKRGKDALITPEEIEFLRKAVAWIDDECRRIQLHKPLDRLAHLRNQFLQINGTPLPEVKLTLEKMAWELDELRRAIVGELFETTFVHVPERMREYCDNPKLFDNESVLVSERFPKARAEIIEAGNCFAVCSYTACVFHLMRVLEYGLRALAKKVHVPFPSKYDIVTWETLLKSIEDEVKKIIGTPKTSKRNKDLEFYNGAVAQFRFFKDAWRNHVMHTRASYDIYEASRVMEHVRDFMRHLATRLKE